MVSSQDVMMAYRLLLGREPENQAVVQEYAQSTPDLKSLRERFLHSGEFAAARVAHPLESVVHLPHSLDWGEPLHVDVHVTPGVLQELLGRVAQTWGRLGTTEPFWSVLSAERFKQENFAKNEDAYYESGKRDVDRLNIWLKRNGIAAYGNGHTCCEYGCGTGRVTRWLADQFSRVIAADISRPHIALAEGYLRRCNLGNVVFRHIESLTVLDQIEPFDLFFSFIVLQHNPPPVIALILAKMLARLRPGGLAFFQVPTYRPNYEFVTTNYLAQPISGEIEMHVLPQRYIYALAVQQNCEILEVQPDQHIGIPLWISNTFLLRKRF